MTNSLLKLYRLKSVPGASLGETDQVVVYAFSPEDALDVLTEAFDDYENRYTVPGYLAGPANPYEVVEEVPFARGVVLAEGQDG